ncbi:MAG TPA: tetratricopeptide repeat protein [Candidatus Acidoferrum sp.]|nr:tetratricopeptide repeat protein [Candidatus Acidoferrum sp.]
MDKPVSRSFACFTAVLLLPLPSLATCGGGGGGGMGGMRAPGMNGGDQQVYQVPWKIVDAKTPPPAGGLTLYWFPSSVDEFKNSSLRNSRSLSLYAAQCVSMTVSDTQAPAMQKLVGDDKLPVAVLATNDGTMINKAQNNKGFLKVDQVEKLVESELKQREESIKQQMKDGKDKAKAGDKEGAITLFRSVMTQSCLFPGKAKDASKELKKLGVETGQVFDAPVMDHAQSAKIEAVMKRGLKAEMDEKYEQSEKLYSQARAMDPADPAPLRYLGELYRHHLGDWDRARSNFDAILAMPADPLSRAVAMHGLGKMTIHEGDFLKGLHLMETSVKEYPLALAYRNLAVYWNSEGDKAKADMYTREATKLDPTDPYNLIFAAAFLAGNGHGDEALKIAKDNEAMLPASYNLAAIYAQLGQKQKALDLLKRHFYQYERYESVRSKEMMEARVDEVFVSLRKDPDFLALTNAADGRLPIPDSKMGVPGSDLQR